MKNLISIFFISIILAGCYPCKFLDWNCNEIDSSWSKKIDDCQFKQKSIAKSILNNNYSEQINKRIETECIKNTSYKFESDSFYKN